MNESAQAACAALLALAVERPWSAITLRDIAERSQIDLATLYRLAPSRQSLLDLIARRHDEAALATAATPSEDVHDRLFDAMMARIEAMEPDRAALVALAREVPRVRLASHYAHGARAILEAAGLTASPLRLAGTAAVLARVTAVWRDDEGALNRTMAEIDLRLKRLRSTLNRLGAGF